MWARLQTDSKHLYGSVHQQVGSDTGPLAEWSIRVRSEEGTLTASNASPPPKKPTCFQPVAAGLQHMRGADAAAISPAVSAIRRIRHTSHSPGPNQAPPLDPAPPSLTPRAGAGRRCFLKPAPPQPRAPRRFLEPCAPDIKAYPAADQLRNK